MVVNTATNRKGCGSSDRLRGWCGTEPRPRSVVLCPRIAVCTGCAREGQPDTACLLACRTHGRHSCGITNTMLGAYRQAVHHRNRPVRDADA